MSISFKEFRHGYYCANELEMELRYFTITVGNITQLMQDCTDAGRKVAVSEREIRPGVRIGIVEDPDGNWVEFLSNAPQ